MAGKGRQTARKPATKFAHLRKKMEKNRIAAEGQQEEEEVKSPPECEGHRRRDTHA
jgi:hypothetical protein